MKKSTTFLAIITGLFIISCSDTNTLAETQAITEEEAIKIVEASLAEESAGIEETTYKYTKTYEEKASMNVQCNQAVTDSYTFYHNGGLVQASYNYDWEYTISCNTFNIPQSATFNSSGSGSYTTPRIQSNDTSTFKATITGLQPLSSIITFNASFKRIGTLELTTNQTTRSISSDFNATLIDLAVEKYDYEVNSGAGTFTLSGTTDQGNFSYDGSIVFNGDGTATVTINGNEYTIILN